MSRHPGDEEPYKRFMVFGYDQYDPLGALNDLQASFFALREAEEFVQKMRKEHDYWTIFDRRKGFGVEG